MSGMRFRRSRFRNLTDDAVCVAEILAVRVLASFCVKSIS